MRRGGVGASLRFGTLSDELAFGTRNVSGAFSAVASPTSVSADLSAPTSSSSSSSSSSRSDSAAGLVDEDPRDDGVESEAIAAIRNGLRHVAAVQTPLVHVLARVRAYLAGCAAAVPVRLATANCSPGGLAAYNAAVGRPLTDLVDMALAAVQKVLVAQRPRTLKAGDERKPERHNAVRFAIYNELKFRLSYDRRGERIPLPMIVEVLVKACFLGTSPDAFVGFISRTQAEVFEDRLGGAGM